MVMTWSISWITRARAAPITTLAIVREDQRKKLKRLLRGIEKEQSEIKKEKKDKEEVTLFLYCFG